MTAQSGEFRCHARSAVEIVVVYAIRILSALAATGANCCRLDPRD
jgi:hypothetical protein